MIIQSIHLRSSSCVSDRLLKAFIVTLLESLLFKENITTRRKVGEHSKKNAQFADSNERKSLHASLSQQHMPNSSCLLA